MQYYESEALAGTWEDPLEERHLIDRAEHEAHAGDGDESGDELEPPRVLCGAVFSGKPKQDPCRKPAGHEHGPDTDWKRDYHSNGLLKWPVDEHVPTFRALIDELVSNSVAIGAARDAAAIFEHGNASHAAFIEIERRLDLVRERTGDDDGTVRMILDILDGRS
jgi:hypothetical protein